MMKIYLILSTQTNTGVDFWIKRPLFEIQEWIEVFLNIDKNQVIEK